MPQVLGPIGKAMDERRDRRAANRAATVAEIEARDDARIASMEETIAYFRELSVQRLADLRKCEQRGREADERWSTRFLRAQVQLTRAREALATGGQHPEVDLERAQRSLDPDDDDDPEAYG